MAARGVIAQLEALRKHVGGRACAYFHRRSTLIRADICIACQYVSDQVVIVIESMWMRCFQKGFNHEMRKVRRRKPQ